jgi:hypothetical protein
MEETNKYLISTSCRDCIFAVYDRSKTQVGCKFDRIEKFEENGANILGQDDGEKKYLVILGRFCTACRNKEWGQNHSKRKWKSIVEDKIKIRLDIIVHVWGQHTLPEIIQTVDSAYNQNPKPKLVVIACEPDYNNVPIIDIVSMIKLKNKGPWRVEKLPYDEASKFCKSTYYAIFNAGYNIPEDFSSKLNKYINEDLKRFVAILPDENGNGLVVQQCGNSLEEIFKKAEETNTLDLIKKHEEL